MDTLKKQLAEKDAVIVKLRWVELCESLIWRAESLEQTSSLGELTKTLSDSREMVEKFHKETKGKYH